MAVEARMRIGEYEFPAQLLNASSGGVLAAIAEPPVRGTKVQLVIGGMVLAGQVRWRGVDCCGIALRDPISVSDLIETDGARAVMISEPRALRGIGGRFRALVGGGVALLRN